MESARETDCRRASVGAGLGRDVGGSAVTGSGGCGVTLSSAFTIDDGAGEGNARPVGLGVASLASLFWATVAVSSCLNLSRSGIACGEVKVKVKLFSSLTSDTFIRTCGFPSFEQNSAMSYRHRRCRTAKGCDMRARHGAVISSFQQQKPLGFNSQRISGFAMRAEGFFFPSCVHSRWVSVSSSVPKFFLKEALAVHTKVGIKSNFGFSIVLFLSLIR